MKEVKQIMKTLNLTGQQFGKLLVLGIDPEHSHNSSGKILWKCQCECGTICYKTADSLKRPVTAKNTMKACSKKCGAAIPIGTKFGKLTVVENIFKENETTKTRCVCECGNEIITAPSRLKNGTTKSCGCYKKEHMSKISKNNNSAVDLSGLRFGKLIAIKPTERRQGRSVVWECKCDCGNIHFASVTNLKNGDVTRCAQCKILSKGEEKIKELLQRENIPFETQKTFETCRSPKTNTLFRFDFYVNNSYLIEFDGKQHFIENNGWEDLQDIQYRDNIKNEWCKQNNIPLIRIPYTKYESLSIEDLLLPLDS